LEILDKYLWEDNQDVSSTHDFGKDILPKMVKNKLKIFAYPYSGYWVDVGTISSYWQANMDLLKSDPQLKLYDRSWVIHTRTEERPPSRIQSGAIIRDSMISDGCIIEEGAVIENSVLSPGVVVKNGARIKESILLTDGYVDVNASIEKTIVDKKVIIGTNARIGSCINERIVLIGKNSHVIPNVLIEPGAIIGNDVLISDFEKLVIQSGELVDTKSKPKYG